MALDRVIVDKLGQNSNVRKRLTTLDGQLKQQMNRIIEHRNDGLTFHHQAVAEVRQDGEQLVQSALGGVVQDSLNEMGTKSVGNGDNPLQAIMGNLGACSSRFRMNGITSSRISRISGIKSVTA